MPCISANSKISSGFTSVKINIPVGVSIFPKEIVPTPRGWAEKRYTNIVYWNELSKGGHFAALEQPDALAREVVAFFADLHDAGA